MLIRFCTTLGDFKEDSGINFKRTKTWKFVELEITKIDGISQLLQLIISLLVLKDENYVKEGPIYRFVSS